ncbi:MAG TPA: hypothetical protein VFA26_00100 [Gemmataceae bacterium]|jgi:hypothetical protein|nr:hypothetical protein [Gemmataceae bacterium]
MTTTTTICCGKCGKQLDAKPKKDGEPRLPGGWGKAGGQTFCPDCWEQCFFLRSVRLPVASVAVGYDDLDWSPDACREAWKEFRQALRLSAQQARACANFFLVELAKCDNEPLEAGPKGPKLPKFNPPDGKVLYALARQRWPELDSQAVSAIWQKARAKYHESRFARRVLGKATLPEFKGEEVPLPVQAKDARLRLRERQPFVALRIAGGRFTLRLRNGRQFERQIAALEQIAAGEAVQGELTLYNKRVAEADPDNGVVRNESGSRRFVSRVMAAFAVWVPAGKGRREQKMLVRTRADKFFEVLVGDREVPWNLNDDQVRRRIAAHRAQLRRLSEDFKMERRRPKQAGAGLAEHRRRLCERHNDWLANHAHQASAIIAGLAARHNADVEYDDTEKGFVPSYPWFKLRTLIAQKLKEQGRSLTLTGTSDENEAQPVVE